MARAIYDNSLHLVVCKHGKQRAPVIAHVLRLPAEPCKGELELLRIFKEISCDIFSGLSTGYQPLTRLADLYDDVQIYKLGRMCDLTNNQPTERYVLQQHAQKAAYSDLFGFASAVPPSDHQPPPHKIPMPHIHGDSSEQHPAVGSVSTVPPGVNNAPPATDAVGSASAFPHTRSTLVDVKRNWMAVQTTIVKRDKVHSSGQLGTQFSVATEFKNQ